MKRLLILLLLFIMPLSLSASSFNKNNIITDAELKNFSSLSASKIKSFLESKGGTLATYTTTDLDGQIKTAAEIIYNACQKYLISPKFILVTLQKEASLITKKNASQKLLDQALGFGCPDGGGCSGKYAGFAKQVDAAADRIMNGYLKDLEQKNSTVSGWGVNVTKNASDGSVTPQNQATAVLYTYTPWIGYHGGNSSVGGNSLFYDIWEKWFGFTSEIISYPDGVLLQDNITGIIYVIKNDEKQAFTSLGALMANYNIKKTIVVEPEVLDQYPEGDKIMFPNYTLLQAPNGAMYLYINGKKRGITSQDIFRNLGYNPEEAIPATWDELNEISNGSLVTEKDIYPGGVLMQDKNTGAIVFIDEKNKKHEVFAKEILETTYKGMPIFSKETEEIKSYKKASPAKFADGELVTSPNSDSVYVIDDGKKRPFKSAKVFEKMGHKWENVIYTDDDILKLHGTGAQVKLNKTTKSSKADKKNKK